MSESNSERTLVSTAPKPFAFVLMPFSEEFSEVYKLGIKPALQDAGAHAERVDEQIFTNSILDRIFTQIAKADILVADMSTRNPNVFYEVGYAHALNKQVILLTQHIGDIPFDLRHLHHIEYKRISDLRDKLSRSASALLKAGIITARATVPNVLISINDTPVYPLSKGTIVVDAHRDHDIF